MASDELCDILDDLSSRFIINLPAEELQSFERILFAIEAAQWFYEDFYREDNPRKLRSYKLKEFVGLMFAHCPLLTSYKHHLDVIYASFSAYKAQIPVRGAVILNPAMDKCILVKGWHANSGWGFPKGKINKDEPDLDCGVREVWEETGFDPRAHIDPNDYLEATIRDQTLRLYIATGVDEQTEFVTQTRKEISKIEWHSIHSLPSYGDAGSRAFYMVMPFIGKLKRWIRAAKKQRKKKRNELAPSRQNSQAPKQPSKQLAKQPSKPPAKQPSSKQPPKQPSKKLSKQNVKLTTNSQMSGGSSGKKAAFQRVNAAKTGNVLLDFSFDSDAIMNSMVPHL